MTKYVSTIINLKKPVGRQSSKAINKNTSHPLPSITLTSLETIVFTAVNVYEVHKEEKL